MNDDLRDKLKTAKEQKKASKKFLVNLKRVKAKKIDALFHEAHEEAFERIDCLDCANCCKTTSPIFRDVDIKRISSFLKMKAADFVETYLKLDEDGDYVLQKAPCSFLGEDNKCSIYEHRPLACREYPHTDRKNMYQLLDLSYRNTLICPAVHDIVCKIKKNLQA